MEYDFKHGYFSHRVVFGRLNQSECIDLLTQHKWRDSLFRLLNILDEIRRKVGIPMTLTSTYRDVNHNIAVGGSPTSQHLTGEAADFAFLTAQRDEACAQFVELITRVYTDKLGQVIIHNSYIHVALPSTNHPKLELNDKRTNQGHT